MYDDKVEFGVFLLHEMTEVLMKDLEDEGKWVVSINDVPGYKAVDVDWSSLRYY